MAVSPHNSNVVFCAGNFYFNSNYHTGISHSSDGGITWEHDTVDTGGRAWSVAFDPVDPNKVYVAGDTYYSYPSLYISTDLGSTWNQSRTGLRGAVNVITPDPYNNQVVYCGTNNAVFKSTNGGSTWDSLSCRQQIKALVIDSTDTNILYAGTYGNGVYVSTNAGVTWDTINLGLSNKKILSLALRAGREPVLFAGSEGNAVFRTIPYNFIGNEPQVYNFGQRFNFSISPNPCYDVAKISVQLYDPAKVGLRIYDRTGRRVASFGNHHLPPGNWFWQWDTRKVASGIYFYQLTVDGQTTASKAIVVKR